MVTRGLLRNDYSSWLSKVIVHMFQWPVFGDNGVEINIGTIRNYLPVLILVKKKIR